MTVIRGVNVQVGQVAAVTPFTLISPGNEPHSLSTKTSNSASIDCEEGSTSFLFLHWLELRSVISGSFQFDKRRCIIHTTNVIPVVEDEFPDSQFSFHHSLPHNSPVQRLVNWTCFKSPVDTVWLFVNHTLPNS